MKEGDIRALAQHFLFNGHALQGTVEETHISWVILTRRYAFKVKKPVRLSFLDFSSLAKRKKFCERELFLNRRFTSIYLQVVPLRRASGKWFFGGRAGTIVDYAVVMKRLQSSKRMDLLLEEGRVTGRHIVRLAGKVGRLHAGAQIVYAPFDGRALRLAFNDIGSVRSIVSEALPRFIDVIRESIAWSDGFLGKHGARFMERASLGYKRDLHGDLHSGNIFLYSNPVIFDCIEFKDAFRQIDVLDEVAFLCMDLDSFGKAGLSQKFLTTYLKVFPGMECEDDLLIFRYYKCYRANVRAKVHALAAMQEDDPAEKKRRFRRVATYLDLIRRYIG